MLWYHVYFLLPIIEPFRKLGFEITKFCATKKTEFEKYLSSFEDWVCYKKPFSSFENQTSFFLKISWNELHRPENFLLLLDSFL